ncbi:hypothetical protein F4561_003628 [Lipingzhangella halophila]|uniref:Uncharacterized protein n=1 Tax=Lipingzhangella halophila TaxID=1783352 RepID=A0A7W7RIV3_9ACTN|nr:hypothetical protein [Lipingzhangella halophila]MBB4932808.1 hypothetical protein [Lipingzhangella halophila]
MPLATFAAAEAPDTEGLADFLGGFLGLLFLVIVSIVAIFFLFTRKVTATAIAIANAMGARTD